MRSLFAAGGSVPKRLQARTGNPLHPWRRLCDGLAPRRIVVSSARSSAAPAFRPSSSNTLCRPKRRFLPPRMPRSPHGGIWSRKASSTSPSSAISAGGGLTLVTLIELKQAGETAGRRRRLLAMGRSGLHGRIDDRPGGRRSADQLRVPTGLRAEVSWRFRCSDPLASPLFRRPEWLAAAPDPGRHRRAPAR